MWALVVSGCGQSTSPQNAVESVRSDPAADWPTGGSRSATVTVLVPEAIPINGADVTSEVFADPAVARNLEDLLGSTLFVADMTEPDQYLSAVVRVVGTASKADGVEVYVALYEQWWMRGASGLEAASTSSGPARLRLHREGSGYELSGVDRPGDGTAYQQGLEAMVPEWAREPVERVRVDLAATFEQITAAAGEEWAQSQSTSVAP
jgi:hypothetical protein